MKCEDILSVLQRDDARADLAKRAAAEHLARCEDCRNAAHAFAVLRADRDLPIPLPADDVMQRAIAAAASGPRPAPSGFWLGVGVGAALAAGLVLAIMTFRPVEVIGPPPSSTPTIVLNVNEQRDVSVALSSPEPLAGAEIKIALRGEIALRGFDDEREVSWRTDLDRGVNQLTLPLIGLHAGSGQVVVEVEHGDKRRSFVVDVLTTDGPPTAAVPSRCGARIAAREGNANARGSCV